MKGTTGKKLAAMNAGCVLLNDSLSRNFLKIAWIAHAEKKVSIPERIREGIMELCITLFKSMLMNGSGLPTRIPGSEYKTIKKTTTGTAAIKFIASGRAVNPAQYENTLRNFFITDLTIPCFQFPIQNRCPLLVIKCISAGILFDSMYFLILFIIL